MPENPSRDEIVKARKEVYLGSVVAPRVESRKLFLFSLLCALALFPLLQVASGRFNYWLHMLLFTFLNVTMAASWNIIGGYAGYISLGHNVFSGIGGYVAGALLIFYGLSPFLTAPLAGVVACLFGLLFGLITLRTRGSAFIIATIALVLLTKLGLDNWELLGGTNGVSLPLLPLPARFVKLPFYYGMLLTAVGAVYLSYRIRHSKFGLGLRAIAQDETKAEVAGIPTSLYKILAFAISGFFPGMAGALWAYYLTYLRPTIYFAILGAAEIVLMVLLGGRGTVAGPVLGAVLLVAMNEFFVARFGSTELNIAGTGLLMLIILIFFPEGIVGTLRDRKKLPRLLDWG
ncbi:MAG: branched-chain amino acid ABC transporter permease [Armatimonadota bacterium]|nr:branched-chain amino acid ABC transporter permease [Armatimonadota bacterium]MDR5702912.1 branched-chain amino acid ABC transporter permease [Armatimonadota bacterium]MDR7435027.1 branched-chain amino acid ABC transporter permease [Armatimonadota bacterium]